MQWYLLALRLAHIVLGALWVGMMAFSVMFLSPAMREAGPAGQSLMAAMQRRRITTIMPLIALGAIISGLLLMQRLYGGSPEFMATDMGMALVTGALAAMLAFVLGVVVTRPVMARMARLSAAIPAATSDAERAELRARMQRLGTRSQWLAHTNLALLFIALSAMAVARYL